MQYQSKKILVVEDEIIIADDIIRSLRSLGYRSFEPALNYSQAIEAIEQEPPSIAIIDINLAGTKDGIDLANAINEQYRFPFIFLTSNSDSQTLHRAKQTMPSAYLLKPFTRQDLHTSLEIALYNYYEKESPIQQEVVGNSDFLLIKQGASYQKLDFNKVVFLRSKHVYVEIITEEGAVHIIRSSLTDLLTRFPKNFARVHRSYAVNLDIIQKININEIVLSNETIPLSKEYRKEILKCFGK
ncbi:MAG TPA: response regulator transcription factor [Williamwhitmania sp.]|nr:response regulator transcription factor [Williamwhitmania sp.]